MQPFLRTHVTDEQHRVGVTLEAEVAEPRVVHARRHQAQREDPSPYPLRRFAPRQATVYGEGEPEAEAQRYVRDEGFVGHDHGIGTVEDAREDSTFKASEDTLDARRSRQIVVHRDDKPLITRTFRSRGFPASAPGCDE